MTDTLVERVGATLRQLMPEPVPVLVAVSGGPDSIALLDLLHCSAGIHGCSLSVAHVDHGISPESSVPAGIVAAAAALRGLPCYHRELGLDPQTTETRARLARRVALRAIRRESGTTAIVLGHHADDQAETVLMRMLGGTGIAGLAAMRPRNGIWLRPVLHCSRADLTAHATARQLSWWIDPANSDSRHLRSWIRSDLMPHLVQRLPDTRRHLLGVAGHAAADRRAWHEVLAQLPGLELRRDSDGISVAAMVLRDYRSGLRMAVLAQLGREVGIRLGRRRISAIETLLAGDRQSGTIDVAAHGRVELSGGRLALYRDTHSRAEPVALVPGAAVRLPPSELVVHEVFAEEARREGWVTDLPEGRYVARAWQAGDRIHPLGGTGSRSVAVLLREAGVAPSKRARWPVVVSQDGATIVWVPGICRADALVPVKGTRAWRVDCVVT